MYDFDKIIDRRGTSCIKYDFQVERRGRDDLLPLWVADMDFALPEDILEDIEDRISHGIFGYTDPILSRRLLSPTTESLSTISSSIRTENTASISRILKIR